MIIRDLSIDTSKCNGCGACTNPEFKGLFSLYPDSTTGAQKAQVNLIPLPVEMQAEAQWAIFRCWEGGPGAIWGRGEPDLPEPI